MNDKKIIIKAEKLLETWRHGSLRIGNLGYKFRYYQFINIAYLYLNGVDAKNPDLLDPKNPHHFIPDFIADLTKINEQTRIDFKELGFLVEGHSELAKYIAKAANRKSLTINNDWTEVQERVTDDANWYGSGYKMIYQDSNNVQKHKHLSPWDIVWDLYDFKNSAKMKVLNRSVKEVIENKRYSKTARSNFKEIYKDDLDKRVEIYQYVDEKNLYIVDLVNGIIFLSGKRPAGLYFSKYDHEYRRGFNDAPGRGIFEKTMNVIVQNKVARERYNEVEAITSKLLYGKVVDGNNDKVQNKQVQNLKTGLIIPVSSPDNIPVPINVGGGQQLQELASKITQTRELYSTILGVPDVLQGDAKTLGANSSGIAIQSLAEYASSVHKDVKKRYAREAEKEYRDYIMPEILKAFNSSDNIKKYIDPTEWNVVKRNIIDYELAVKQAELLGEGIAPEEVNALLVDEEEKLRKDFKNRNIITEDILEALRDDVQAIQIVISGEKASRQVRSEFYNTIMANYMQNPQVLDDPKYIALIKKQAKNAGIDELEVTEFLNNIK